MTPFHPDEKYASGDYPNVHAGGDGLPRYIAQNRSIENTDIVLWHSFGHTHVCKPEDFPVMPVEYAGFVLKPNGFFSANAASDVQQIRMRHPSMRASARRRLGKPKAATDLHCSGCAAAPRCLSFS